MSIDSGFGGLVIAALALYGLGIPLAWLGPAPLHSPWLLRIAAAPLYAITFAWLASLLLGAMGVALHPGILVGALAVAWVVAWRLTRSRWSARDALSAALGPVLMVASSLALWVLTLVGFGMYLPNRDFKNHAYFVAQVAWLRSRDPDVVLRAAPTSAPLDGGFYPLGLHTVLGWALPSTTSPSVAVTAAAAVLVTSVSMPLGVVVLARQWSTSRALWWLSGFAAVAGIGVSGGFRIGSVVLLCAASLYVAGLALVWTWVRQPSASTTIGVIVALAGLLALHVAEAVGLGLIALILAPVAIGRVHRRALTPAQMAGVALAGAAGLAVAAWVLQRLAANLGPGLSWTDIQPNDRDPATALGVALLQQPEGTPWVSLLWAVLALAGFWLGVRRRLSPVLAVAFAVPVVLGALCVAAGVPAWLGLITAPWYGSAARVGLMAMGPVLVAGSLALVGAATSPSRKALRVVGTCGLAAATAALALQVVPLRRADLRATLAGAGDTDVVARELESMLSPGQTVLNFEGDGTANLFALARVPVLAGWFVDPAVEEPLADGRGLLEQLHRVADPDVERRMRELNVAYVALGSTSRYWDPEPGYLWQQLLKQPQLTLALTGSDLVVLRYQEVAP